MARSAHLDLIEVERLQRWVLAQVCLIAEEVVPHKLWVEVAALTASVDPGDTPYVALSLMYGCPIWTGDKKLSKGLAAVGFTALLSTAEVRERLDLD